MTLIRNGLMALVVSFGATFSALSLANEEYRLSAFADVLGYAQIKSKDIASAKEFVSFRSQKKLDFLELNNLCVLGVLIEDFNAAIDACKVAIEKSGKSREIGFSSKKKALASIHSNLAVAKALSGDLEGAQYELQMALSLNSRDTNAILNLAWLETSNIVAGL
tara:strand:+ start:257 stop:748 length:492 start_codon:yes stop_codon:yes gene_type:complete